MTCCFHNFGMSLARKEKLTTNNHSNEDVSETMYKETIKSKDLQTKSSISADQIGSKVNRICDGFVTVLQDPQHKDRRLQNLITAHVSKVPPDLTSGLEMIGRLQSE